MLIGIISDSHDDLHALKIAVQFFNEQGTDLVLHAGDLTSPFMIKALSALDCEFKMSFGNNDGDKITINKWLSGIKGSAGEFIETECSNKKIGMLHGTNQTIVDSLVKSKNFDIIISGHTHTPLISRGPTLHINPGESSGVLSGNKTVALLKPEKLEAEIITL